MFAMLFAPAPCAMQMLALSALSPPPVLAPTALGRWGHLAERAIALQRVIGTLKATHARHTKKMHLPNMTGPIENPPKCSDNTKDSQTLLLLVPV